MTDVGIPLTDAKRRIVDYLKRASPSSTQEVAAILGVTDVAARQHLGALHDAGLVGESTETPRGRGRPPSLWRLTELAMELFPDRHGDLTVELLGALRESVGEAGVEALIDVRGKHQLEELREALATSQSLEDRVRALAAHRTQDGYMAEVTVADDGLLLTEHHCPICAAASSCQGLCRSELEIFREALGPGAVVERIEHLLGDGRRCVYRISASSKPVRTSPM